MLEKIINYDLNSTKTPTSCFIDSKMQARYSHVDNDFYSK